MQCVPMYSSAKCQSTNVQKSCMVDLCDKRVTLEEKSIFCNAHLSAYRLLWFMVGRTQLCLKFFGRNTENTLSTIGLD